MLRTLAIASAFAYASALDFQIFHNLAGKL